MEHSQPMGTPDSEMVRKRAHEIALIAGRSTANEEHFAEAARELHGGHYNNALSVHALVSEHDMVASNVGRHVENIAPENDENLAEELLAEGMDEALHEQMLAASRLEPREEEEEESLPGSLNQD